MHIFHNLKFAAVGKDIIIDFLPGLFRAGCSFDLVLDLNKKLI